MDVSSVWILPVYMWGGVQGEENHMEVQCWWGLIVFHLL
jgi:hypothetical protein